MKAPDKFSDNINTWLQHLQSTDRDLLTQACVTAYTLADEYEVSEREPLLEHGLAIATQLQSLNSDNQTLAAAIIYPVYRQSSMTKEALAKLIDRAYFKIAHGQQTHGNHRLHVKKR